MEIVEFFMKVMYNLLTKKSTIADDNRSGCSRQMRGESDLSKIYSELGKLSINCKQRYVDNTRV